MELSLKLLGRTLNIGVGKQKAFTQTADPNNELYQSLLSQILGTNFSLPNFNLDDAISKGYVINPNLYAVINKKIKTASRVPFYLYEQKKDKLNEVKMYKAALRSNNLDEAQYYQGKAYQLIEIKEINDMLAQPNENESFSEFLEAALGYYNLTGNGFVYGLNPEGFDPSYFSKLYTMPSQLTKIVTSSDWQNIIAGYTVDWFGTGRQVIDKSKVCHIKMWNPDVNRVDVGLYGLSPMSALCVVNENSNANFIAQLKLLKHGRPAGILSTETERGLNPDQLKENQDRFDDKYGYENQNKIVLSAHAVKWQALGLNSVDLQLLESNRANLETIARVYNVPLPLLINDASTMDNMKVSEMSLWNNSIIPDLSRIRDDLFNKFYLAYWIKKTGRKLYIDYDLNGVEALKRDEKTQLETISMELENGIITPNQAREKRGYELVSDPLMDKYYLKQGLRPIDQPYTTPTQTPPAK